MTAIIINCSLFHKTRKAKNDSNFGGTGNSFFRPRFPRRLDFGPATISHFVKTMQCDLGKSFWFLFRMRSVFVFHVHRERIIGITFPYPPIIRSEESRRIRQDRKRAVSFNIPHLWIDKGVYDTEYCKIKVLWSEIHLTIDPPFQWLDEIL